MKNFIFTIVAVLLSPPVSFCQQQQQQQQIASQPVINKPLINNASTFFRYQNPSKELRQAYVNYMVQVLVGNKLYADLAWFVNEIKKQKQKKFETECLRQFKSRALCITNTQSFYIWQQIEVARLRHKIMTS